KQKLLIFQFLDITPWEGPETTENWVPPNSALEITLKSRTTFQEILLAVATRNIRALEDKARAASALASVYPSHQVIFRELESDALRQMFLIVTCGLQTDADASGQTSPRQTSARDAVPDEKEAAVQMRRTNLLKDGGENHETRCTEQ